MLMITLEKIPDMSDRVVFVKGCFFQFVGRRNQDTSPKLSEGVR